MVVLLAALHSLPVGGARGGRARQLRLVEQARVRHRADARADPAQPARALAFIGKMKIFDLVWITTKGGPLWATETVSTYVYKRAFKWNTFDLGYPSAIAVVWFVIVLGSVLSLTWRSASASGWSTDRWPGAPGADGSRRCVRVSAAWRSTPCSRRPLPLGRLDVGAHHAARSVAGPLRAARARCTGTSSAIAWFDSNFAQLLLEQHAGRASRRWRSSRCWARRRPTAAPLPLPREPVWSTSSCSARSSSRRRSS